MGLTSLHGRMPPACQLGEVLAAVAMEGNAPAQAPPRGANLVQGLHPGPLSQGLLADLQQDRAAAQRRQGMASMRSTSSPTASSKTV
jgi:hypothetical protein